MEPVRLSWRRPPSGPSPDRTWEASAAGAVGAAVSVRETETGAPVSVWWRPPDVSLPPPP